MSGSTPNRRSRFGLVGLTALVVVGALLIILAFLRSTSAESRPACKTGKQELDGGFARAAAQTYKQERTKSDATCVREGLRDSVLALCALGGTFIHSGLYAQAKATYEAALDARPRATCGRVGLRRAAVGRCRLAERLEHQHRSDEAQAVRKAIPADDSVVCATAGS